jgi:hypothetical protein
MTGDAATKGEFAPRFASGGNAGGGTLAAAQDMVRCIFVSCGLFYL